VKRGNNMGRKMSRGKHQVLFNYLPGKTFDFERVATIAQVTAIRGMPRNDLNTTILLHKVKEDAKNWQEDFRPVLRDEVLNDAERFVLLDPKGVQAEMFPKVFWCQNRQCGRVFDYSQSDTLPTKRCKICRNGSLIQLRFVKIHRCGALQPLLPPFCQRCKSAHHMALDTRGSERFANFRWICRQCKNTLAFYASVGPCRECRWPPKTYQLEDMNVEVHRAGRTFYAHSTVMLNIPHRDLDAFFNIPEWPAIAAAKYFNFSEVEKLQLSDFALSSSSQGTDQEQGLSGQDLDNLLKQFASSPAKLPAAMAALRQQRQQEQQAASPKTIAQLVEQRTGVELAIWNSAKQEMLDAVTPTQSGRPMELFKQTARQQEIQVAQTMGLAQITLVSDYPIVTATYGFSRAEYASDQCRLNPFPPERDHNGKFPIYVDEVQADAVLMRLNPERIQIWLERNGFQPKLPKGQNSYLSLRAYFVQLFHDVLLGQTLQSDQPQARLVFGLLHTFSHFSVRQAALLCGLDSTSLSEYLLPRTLTFAIYSNHRDGATIGALTALYEQSLIEWLNAIRNKRHCVYDPVCHDREGSCHACTHLAETSCRFFNLNLNRSFLFGGPDKELGEIKVGYLDPSLP